MKTRIPAAWVLCAGIALGQAQPNSARPIVVKAARVLDIRQGKYLENAAIWIDGEHIKEVGPVRDIQSHAPKDAKTVDLGRATLLPGLIDCHTHIMARFEEGPNGYLLGLATKSQAFRALEGAYNAASLCKPATPPFAT